MTYLYLCFSQKNSRHPNRIQTDTEKFDRDSGWVAFLFVFGKQFETIIGEYPTTMGQHPVCNTFIFL